VIETATQFPVVPGTVVEITCSESGAINKGSNTVTCVTGTEFTYSTEPSCQKPGNSHQGSIEKYDPHHAHGCMTLKL
jgi:hypothetical protein